MYLENFRKLGSLENVVQKNLFSRKLKIPYVARWLTFCFCGSALGWKWALVMHVTHFWLLSCPVNLTVCPPDLKGWRVGHSPSWPYHLGNTGPRRLWPESLV